MEEDFQDNPWVAGDTPEQLMGRVVPDTWVGVGIPVEAEDIQVEQDAEDILVVVEEDYLEVVAAEVVVASLAQWYAQILSLIHI